MTTFDISSLFLSRDTITFLEVDNTLVTQSSPFQFSKAVKLTLKYAAFDFLARSNFSKTFFNTKDFKIVGDFEYL